MIAITPNEQQQKAIEHSPGPLMILAGAGTGKTFTLENRILYLIRRMSIEPEHILTITYTEQAAKELKDRIVKKTGRIAHTMTVSTFHSFCYQLLKEHSPEVLPQLLEESEAIHMLLEQFDTLAPFASDEFPLNPQKAVIESFIPFFNRTRDELIKPDKMDLPAVNDHFGVEALNQVRDLQRIYPIFQSWKREMNVVDYGDMILLAYELLRNNSSVLSKVREQFENVVVDEFQDNNFALNKIIGMIVKHSQNITVVGDEDQTIYSFRGANAYNIIEFQRRYKCDPIPLQENYRSSQQILDVANVSIKNNKSNHIHTTLIAHNNRSGPKPKMFWGEKNEQLDYLCKAIKTFLKKGSDKRDIAVLARTHGQAVDASRALLKSGIPVQARIPPYFNIPAVKDLVSWAQVVGGGQYQDNSLYRLIEQRCGAEATYTIYSQWQRWEQTPRLSLIRSDQKLIDSFPGLADLIDTINRLTKIIQKRSAGEMLWEICTTVALLRPYERRYTLDDKLALLNVGDLLQRAQNFSKRNPQDHDLDAFNVYIEAVMMAKGLKTIVPLDYNRLNGVRVSTVHSVKGGEFPIVFIPFLRSGSFPLNMMSKHLISRPPDQWLAYEKSTDLTPKEHHIEEERRLLYVAVTRAQDHLIMMAPKKASSLLVKELNKNLFEETNMNGQQSQQPYSDLRIKYEQKIQKALAAEQFDAIHDYTNALEVIHQTENNHDVQLGNSAWELELAKELKTAFAPSIQEQLYLSASAIETYEQCPLKYRFGYIDSIPQSASKPALIFGNVIHRVLQRFHEPGKKLTEKRVLRLFKEEWNQGKFDYTVREEKFMEQGQELLQRYVHYIAKNPPYVIAREERFVFALGDITISGAIDRIDKDENGIHVVDYKTSKTSTPAKSNLQLAIYSMYLEQSDSDEYGGLPASASLHFLRDAEKPLRKHSFKHDELLDIHEKIKTVVKRIRNKEFPAKTGRYCDWCDYKQLICPAWEAD